jgi:hypothetical protein
MNDLGSLIGALMCFIAPIGAFVTVLIVALRPRTASGLEARVDMLEHELRALRAEATTLTTRMSQLERGTHRSSATAPPADAPPVMATDGTTTAPTTPGAAADPVPPPQPEQEGPISGSHPASGSEMAAESEAAAEPEPTPRSTAPSGSGAGSGSGSGAPAGSPRPPLEVPAEPFSWERWVGVRGAAALGAMILVLAGLYFFQYSIEHGLIGPALRVAIGAVIGLGCLVSSEWPLRQRAPALSGWIAGAGIAILYITSWAASALYDLVPLAASGVLMIAVTITCVVLSLRHASMPIAMLGLCGGFLTPLVLSTGQDRPISLFTYLLLLDVALLVVAHRRRWPALALVSFAATSLYELMWIFGRMSSDTIAIGGVIVIAFGALFALFPSPAVAPEEDGAPPARSGWITTLRVGAVLYPFLLAIAFAGSHHGPIGLGATATLLLALTIGGSVIARRDRMPMLALAASSAAVGVLAVGFGGWSMATPEAALAPLGLGIAIALVFHVAAELDRGRTAETVIAAAIASTGLVAVSLVVALTRDVAWPPLALAWAILIALGLRQACLPNRAWLAIPPSIIAPLAFSLVDAIGGDDAPLTVVIALVPAQAVLFQIAATLGRGDRRAVLDVAAALSALAGALLLAISATSAPLPAIAAVALLALLALFAASREGGSPIALAAAIVAALSFTILALAPAPQDVRSGSLAIVALATIVLTAWPALVRRLAASPWGWRASALAAPLAFLALRHLWLAVLGDRFVGLLAIACAALSLGFAFLASRRASLDPAVRRVAIVWLAAATAGFVTLAIPLQLDNEWWTIGWALEGAALLALDRRLDHPGLKYLAIALFAATCTRLLLNPYVLAYYPRGDIRIFNWLSYTYLVPAIAMIAGSRLLVDLEVGRRRAWETGILPSARPYLASLLFGAALVVIFGWINLTIFDWYATGPALTIPLDRMPARDLTVSIAWALYALALLGLGMWRTAGALRITSLALLVVTAAKVFLYDLGHLRDLYRVGALFGLALSLIAVSLAYQRFVFRKHTPEAA